MTVKPKRQPRGHSSKALGLRGQTLRSQDVTQHTSLQRHQKTVSFAAGTGESSKQGFGGPGDNGVRSSLYAWHCSLRISIAVKCSSRERTPSRTGRSAKRPVVIHGAATMPSSPSCQLSTESARVHPASQFNAITCVCCVSGMSPDADPVAPWESAGGVQVALHTQVSVSDLSKDNRGPVRPRRWEDRAIVLPRDTAAS